MPLTIGDKILSFREFAKDYQIEYVDQPGKKRPKAVRVYIGPWYRFVQPPERIRFLKRFYLCGVLSIAAMLLIPMCLDCAFTRAWYIQVPAVIAWLPWIFAACATWRLWTAKERVDREHNALMGNRMSSSTLVMAGFTMTSLAGCVYAMATQAAAFSDYVVFICCMFSGFVSIALFSKRKSLDMVKIDS